MTDKQLFRSKLRSRHSESLPLGRIALLTVISVALAAAPLADSVYRSLSLYNGTWRVTRKNAPAGSKPEELKNECSLVGKFYTCQQSVNGSVTGLLILIPASEAGHYNTQTVLPEGRASGKGELVITGDRWVFSSIWNQGTRTVRYRTTNVFTDRNHIHFEQEESTDGTHWQVTDSGDDVRITSNAR